MTYDFDMLSVIPKETQQKFSGLFSMFGMTEQARQQVAVLRDAEAVAAISGACEAVRTCLAESGVALNGYHCRMEDGGEAVRAEFLERLEANLKALPADADWNGFDIDLFFAEAGVATPLNEVASFSTQRMIDKAKPLAARVTSRTLSAPAPSF